MTHTLTRRATTRHVSALNLLNKSPVAASQPAPAGLWGEGRCLNPGFTSKAQLPLGWGCCRLSTIPVTVAIAATFRAATGMQPQPTKVKAECQVLLGADGLSARVGPWLQHFALRGFRLGPYLDFCVFFTVGFMIGSSASGFPSAARRRRRRAQQAPLLQRSSQK